MEKKNILKWFIITLLIIFIIAIIVDQCILKENFTAPGLTLTSPPKWFPQIAARPYQKNDWKVKTYLDRYPFYNYRTGKYKSTKESNQLASTNRFWLM